MGILCLLILILTSACGRTLESSGTEDFKPENFFHDLTVNSRGFGSDLYDFTYVLRNGVNRSSRSVALPEGVSATINGHAFTAANSGRLENITETGTLFELIVRHADRIVYTQSYQTSASGTVPQSISKTSGASFSLKFIEIGKYVFQNAVIEQFSESGARSALVSMTVEAGSDGTLSFSADASALASLSAGSARLTIGQGVEMTHSETDTSTGGFTLLNLSKSHDVTMTD